MRRLNTGDLFNFSRLLKRAQLKDLLATLFSESRKAGANDVELGIQIAIALLDAAADAQFEQAVYEFLAPITGKKPQEIAEQELEATFEDIGTIIRDNDILSFFRRASSLPTVSST